ncbi:MAG TPA: aminotransferase class IV [Ruminiclostridium sp.]
MTFEDNIGNICVINGEILPQENLKLYTQDKYLAFYEVIRIIKGIPLFYDNHYTRLKSSMDKSSYELELSKKALKDQIQKVCELNKLSNCNIKVIVLQYGTEQIVLIFVNKFYYPTKQEYDYGVMCCTINLKRSNPNIKMIHVGYKEEIKRVSDEKNVFEVLLVNDKGKITEGSKSNTFFVKGNKIYTSPEDYVLMGITRQYVIDVCTNLGYEVIETLIGIDSLTSFDAVFITGTSIGVLPVRTIDDYVLDSANDHTTQHVMASYNSLVISYINDN